MAANPKDFLKKLMADNPSASESELLVAFKELLKNDKDLSEAIRREVTRLNEVAT